VNKVDYNYASAEYAVVVCPSVRLNPVLHQND